MNFKQFLAEDFTSPLAEAAKAIGKHCKPFLLEAGDVPLFRGIPRVSESDARSADEQSDKLVVRFTSHPKNRPPKDSDTDFNFMFNAMMDLGFDEITVRRHTIYATAVQYQAEKYGALNFIFPLGDFKFFWSKIIKDSFEDRNKIYMYLSKELDRLGIPDFNTLPRSKFDGLFIKILELYDYGFPVAWCNGGPEAEKITEQAYHDVFQDAPIPKYFYKTFKKALANTAKKLYIDSTDFKGALKSRGEISIYESGGYYAVPANLVYEDMIQKKLPITDRYQFKTLYEHLLSLIP